MFQSTIYTRSYSGTTKQYHNSGSEGHNISRDMDRLQFNLGKHVQCLTEKLSRICLANTSQNITHRAIESCLLWIYTFNNIIWYNDMGLIIKSYTSIKITKKKN